MKLNEIQIARTIAILAVLIVHSSSTGVTMTPHDSLLFPFYNLFNIAGKLGTPTFIMLSSFVLFYTYFPKETNLIVFKNFYVKRLKFILVPYLVFSIFYFLVKWVAYYDYPSVDFAVQKFLGQFALGKAHPHLYFVFISVQLYILFPIFITLFKRSEFLRKNAIWIGLVLQWTWVYLNKNYFGITMKGSISLSYLSFYFLGAFLGIYYEDIKRKLRDKKFKSRVMAIIFSGYIFMVFIYTEYMYLVRTGGYEAYKGKLPIFVGRYIAEFSWAMHALFAGLVIVYVSYKLVDRIDAKKQAIFAEIGATSFGIYLIHPFFLMLLREIVPNGSPVVFHLWQILTFVIVSVLSWLVVRSAFNFIPYSWVIFGQDSNKQKR